MSNNYKSVPLSVSTFYKDKHPLFDENNVTVEIGDEAAGGYIILRQDEDVIELDMEHLEEILKIARNLIDDYDKVINDYNDS